MEKLFIQDGDVKREFNEAEYAQYALDQAENKKQADEAKAKAAAKAALLAKLGITADEAALLLA
jgi:hypothetical protein